MDFNHVVTISADVLAQEVGSEMVLLDLEAEVYFGLDEVGTSIWHMLAKGKNLGSVIDVLAAEYDIQENILRRDVEALLGQLREARLIDVALVN